MNPFQSIYDSLVTAISVAPVTALVASANIVRLDSALEPLLDDRNTGDLPMLRLIPVPGGERNLHASSGTATFQLAFRLDYATDQEELDAAAGLFAVDWAVMQALHGALPNLGSQFVTKFDIGEWSPIEPFEVDTPQEFGWRSSLLITVDGCVQRDDLRYN